MRAHPDFAIRRAEPEDVGVTALVQATIGRIGHALSGAATDEDAVQVLAEFFARPGNRLSYLNTLVAQRAAGPLLDAPFAARLRALGLPHHIDPETERGEYYLDTLVVAPGARGRGVGRSLVHAVIEQARSVHSERLGLLVEPGNIPAARLYAALGFREAGRRTVSGDDFLHLTLDL